jgi:ABC-2 type transport system permease protein
MMIATVRSGVARGGIELRQTLTTWNDLFAYIFPTVLLLGAIFFMRDAHVPGTDFSLGAQALPSSFGMGLAFGGLMTIAQLLVADREDGTLLRAKATPNGMLGYLIGKVVLVGGMLLINFVLQLVPGVFLVHGLHVTPTGWLVLIWLVPLGLVATMPIGAVIGSLFDSPRNMALIMLPVIGLIAVSGVFYPITALPGWVQAVAQCFPVYWMGLGMRSVFLPSSLAAVELGHSWRHWEVLAMLTFWSAVGLTLAPAFLRRMARRESGSAVQARRQRALVTMGR